MKLIKAILYMMRIVRILMVNSASFNLAEINELDRSIEYTTDLIHRMEDDD